MNHDLALRFEQLVRDIAGNKRFEHCADDFENNAASAFLNCLPLMQESLSGNDALAAWGRTCSALLDDGEDLSEEQIDKLFALLSNIRFHAPMFDKE